MEVHTTRDHQDHACDKCHYKTKSIDHLRSHLLSVHRRHRSNVHNANNHQRRETERHHMEQLTPLRSICMYWNRGECKFRSEECRFKHINLPACRYQDRCQRYECKFFHEENTMKYPFLGQKKGLYPQ